MKMRFNSLTQFKANDIGKHKSTFANYCRKNAFIGDILKNPLLYLLILPGVAYLLIFHYAPIYGVVIAFKNFSVAKGIGKSPWVGLQNFEYLLRSKEFFNIFKNSVLLSLTRLVWAFPVPIVFSLLLNEIRHIAFKRVTQTLIYIPHFISWVVLAGIITNILSPSAEGIVNYFVKALGHEPINFLLEPKYFRGIIVCAEIWKDAGWGTIIYLAAISNIDQSLYESAIVDGANRLKQMWYITLPGIASTIVVLLILKMGYLLSNGFEQVFLLYNAMTYSVADVFETYTYRVGLLEGRFSFATAVGIFQSVIGLVLILTSNKLSRKYNGSGLW